MVHCYLFEAKSIQSYLFSTDKLKEIVGASEIVEYITSEAGLLDGVIERLKVSVDFSRKGGGGFAVFGNSWDVRELARYWSILLVRYAPGLNWVQGIGIGENELEAYQNARKEQQADANRLSARLPQGNPFTLRFSRTGEPAAKKEYKETLDESTARKRLGFVYDESGAEKRFYEGEWLARRFDPDSHYQQWPVNLTPEEGDDNRNFPFVDDKKWIALVHIDGNGFGQLLIALGRHAKDNPAQYSGGQFIETFRSISYAIAKATEKAAQHAVKEVLEPRKTEVYLTDERESSVLLYPARPVVLGGDDMTIIVRADLALAFSESYIKAFEAESEKALQEVVEQVGASFKLPGYLTACGGIAYAKATYPFYRLHEEVESLCGEAKASSRSVLEKAVHSGDGVIPSSLKWSRTTASLGENEVFSSRKQCFDSDNIDNNTTETGQIVTAFDAWTYFLGRGGGKIDGMEIREAALLEDLKALLSSLDDGVSVNGLRSVYDLLLCEPDQAERQYQRWCDVIASRDKAPPCFDAMKKLVGDGYLQKENVRGLPLVDLLAINAVTKREEEA